MEVLRDARSFSQALLKSLVELTRYLSDSETMSPSDSENDHQDTCRSEPPGAPPGRKDHDTDFSTLLPPIPMDGSTIDLKFVPSRRERRIACQALCARDLIPLPLETLELVAVMSAFRIGVTEGCEFE